MAAPLMSASPGKCERQLGPALVVDKNRFHREVHADGRRLGVAMHQPAQDPTTLVQLDGHDRARQLLSCQTTEWSVDDNPRIDRAGAANLYVDEFRKPALRAARH